MSPTPKPQTRIPVTTVTARHDKQEIIKEVNEVLSSHYERRAARAKSLHPRYGRLTSELAALVAAGGKRARPYLTVVIYESYGGSQFKDICCVGAGIELLHSAMLIHDDIIDRDQVRYGVDNISGKYRKLFSDRLDHAEAAHYADSVALLAGDINLSDAYQLVLESGFPAEHKLMVQKILGEAVFRVVGGELIDTDAVLYPDEETDPIVVAQTKTAHYSFVTPMLIGATLAGADEDELAKLEMLGMNLGTAFQLADDILGAFGDEARTGKSNIGDIREGRRNQLIRSARQKADAKQLKLLEALYGKHDISANEADIVRSILEETGAKEDALRDIQSYAERSADIVRGLKVDGGSKQILYDFIASMTKREA